MADRNVVEKDARALGMKSELFTAIVNATTDDWTGHLPNCGYTDEEQTCGCSEWGARLARAIAPFVPTGRPAAKHDALRARIASLAERYENTSRDTRIRPDVIAAYLRDALTETEAHRG